MAHLRGAADALLDCPTAELAHELSLFRRPGWVGAAWPGADDAGRPGRRRLLAALESLHRQRIAPYWAVVLDRLEREEERLASRLARHGVASVLSTCGAYADAVLTLPHAGAWRPGPVSARLDGRGLTLVPSFFARRPEPYFPIDRRRPAVLFVPVRLPGGPTTRPGPVQPPGARDRVAALLGPTRTRVLIAIVRGPRSTSDLARGLGISLSSASQHASVLRTPGWSPRCGTAAGSCIPPPSSAGRLSAPTPPPPDRSPKTPPTAERPAAFSRA